ncbi:MAG: bifunctional serine/threonine-protein kinase/formylglycine-generating enzyme family protein [Planctomycetota bacterium]|nr:bifunctional serine/threonine-protein kinase/formylglycine-generating enzyme family protein [Planctomycetota bacterium]
MNAESLKAAFAAEPYELLEKIGEGGYGEVWSARRRTTESGLDALDLDDDFDGPLEAPQSLKKINIPSKVAIKILKDSEAVLGPKLEHDHIIRIYDTGSILDRSYQIMEFFPGDNLRLKLPKVAKDVVSARRIILPLLEAMEYAHQRGIVHRDIKPENVLVQQTNNHWQVKLTDFGLAREVPSALIQSATFAASFSSGANLAGTVAYLAPELLQNPDSFSPQSDLYSLGVLIFELLTGTRPSGLELPSELNPKLSKKFNPILKGLLSSHPKKRPQSAAEVRKQLLPLFRIDDQPGAPIIFSSSTSKDPKSSKRKDLISEELDMVLIEECSFVQGHDDDPFARPRRLTTLDSYWMDRYPVTNEAYLEFVRATGHTPPKTWKVDKGNWHTLTAFRLSDAQAALPVVGITYEDAKTYAEWAGKRLPSEAEWERAAQGPRAWPYPYGESFSANVIHSDPKSLSSVDKFYHGRSLEGIFDLTGNAWEWCLDWYDRKAYREKDVKNPIGPEKGNARVIRGGYDPELKGSGSAFFRSFLRPDMTHKFVGFRCAKTASTEAEA